MAGNIIAQVSQLGRTSWFRVRRCSTTRSWIEDQLYKPLYQAL
jgi:hypothetical protein